MRISDWSSDVCSSDLSPGTLKQDGPKIANGGTAGGNSSQLQSKLGEIREVQLPDGSRVTLDTDSLVLTKFDRDLRDVRLVRGRARFNVEKDNRDRKSTRLHYSH